MNDNKTAYRGKDYPVHSSGPWSVSAGIALIKRGLIEGCTCGCRGDFLLTLAGEKYLEETLNDSTN